MARLLSTAEMRFALACLILSLLAFVFLGTLVAAPKLLFGRALTAIPPSLFPRIVLGALAVMSLILVLRLLRSPVDPDLDTGMEGLRRGAAFFGIMTVYALTMAPLGFLISSALAMSALSILSGNRTIWQIALLSVAGPALLYLAATRLLAVSLPELNAIELFYARLLPW